MSDRSDTSPDALFDGRYRIVRRLGQGGMARVFLAQDESPHRPVAAPISSSGTASTSTGIARTTVMNQSSARCQARAARAELVRPAAPRATLCPKVKVLITLCHIPGIERPSRGFRSVTNRPSAAIGRSTASGVNR